ncbi:MAG: hypothetical protein J0H84_24490 [Rhizobiales bacterium]|jgi:hypothetical protein|nr:hypothetical protein [Hyphomicrobiales bacterium]
MKNKIPWYIYPHDEPKMHRRGDDPLALLVGLLFLAIFVLVALDHALYRIWAFVEGWLEAINS